MTRIPGSELFPTEDPVPAGELIGREADLDGLLGALENRTHCILAEPRRLGKTTLARAALAELRERGFYTVAVDLWQAADQVELASALVAKTIENRPALKRLPHRLREGGTRATDAVQVAATTRLSDELGQEVALAWKPSLADRDPRRYIRFALELPQRIAEKDGKRVIVFFDEFQTVLDLEDPAHPKALQRLIRSVYQDANRVALLFAGSLQHLMRNIFSADQPLGNFGGFYDLSPIDASHWRTGIADRLARDNSTITDGALDLLVEFGELHPRATMLIAQQAYIAAVAQDTHEVDRALIALGHAQARDHDRARHQTVVDLIRGLGGRRMKQLALKVIRQIARGEPIYGGVTEKDKPAIGRTAKALQGAGYVESRGHGHGWRIVDPLLRAYLAELDPAAD